MDALLPTGALPDLPGFFAVLFAILSMQALQRLTPRQGALLIGLFAALTAVSLVRTYGASQALAFALLYTALNAFLAAYALATRRAQAARAQNQTLMQQLWEGFGLGSDADQRQLLRRIAQHWLAPGGYVVMDVYSPIGPARHAGSEVLLPPLEGVPGSVEMIERCHFDPVHSRWIDEWQPTQEPEKTFAPAIRCYSPADFLLLTV